MGLRGISTSPSAARGCAWPRRGQAHPRAAEGEVLMPRKPIQYLLTFERKDDKGLTHKTFVTQTVYDGKPPVSPFAAKVERKRFKKLTAQVPARKPSDDWYRQQAINYALWLAKRDGI